MHARELLPARPPGIEEHPALRKLRQSGSDGHSRRHRHHPGLRRAGRAPVLAGRPGERPLFQLHQPPDARALLLQPDGGHLHPGPQRERPHEGLRGRMVARVGRRPQNGGRARFHQWEKESVSGPRRICHHPAGGTGKRCGPAQEQTGAHSLGSSGRAPCRGLLPHAPGHYGAGV